jgi:FkbM family methyltransferase
MPNIKILPNGVMVVADDTHISKWVEQANDIEIARAFISQFSSHIRPGSTVIDIGACIGDHTATYSNLVGPTGRVVALECGGDSFACLAHNMERHPNVVALKLAVGSATGRGDFIRSPNIGASHLHASKSGSVQIVSLDALVKLLELKPGFIKIDAEGWEHMILCGASATLAAFKPHMVLEINHGALLRSGSSRQAVFQKLDELGYAWSIIGRDGINDPQYDILAYPKT